MTRARLTAPQWLAIGMWSVLALCLSLGLAQSVGLIAPPPPEPPKVTKVDDCAVLHLLAERYGFEHGSLFEDARRYRALGMCQ